MGYSNISPEAVKILGSNIFEYRNYIIEQKAKLNQFIEGLESSGKWADDNYRHFCQNQLSQLNEEIAVITNTLDNEMLPFLEQLYNRASEY